MILTGEERRRVLLVSGLANSATVVLSGFVGLVSVPLGLHYFGPVRYGVWIVISSVISYMGLCNFGMPNATMTLVAQAREDASKRLLLLRSLKITAGLGLFFVALTLALTRSVPGWGRILGQVPAGLTGEATTALTTISVLTFLQFPTLNFSAAFSGLQEMHWDRIYGSLRALSLLAALVGTIWSRGNLVTLALFAGMGTAMVGIGSGVHLWLRHPEIRFRSWEQSAGAASTTALFTSGIRFLALQIGVLIIWNSDNLIISHVLGPAMVTPYAVTFKLFQACFLMMTASVVALWPMYAQASGQGDWHWIQRIYDSSVTVQILIGGLIWIAGILFAEPVIGFLAPGAYGGPMVAFALGGYIYLSSFFGANAGLINGLNPTSDAVFFGLAEAVLNVGTSLVLIRYLGIGGVALGTFLASLAINSWAPPLYIRRRTKTRLALTAGPVVRHTLGVIFFVAIAVTASLHLADALRWISGLVIVCAYFLCSWCITLPTVAYIIAAAFPKISLTRQRLKSIV